MNLTLFFTRNVSLNTWDRIGSIDREVELYRKFYDRGITVSFVTYGTRKDRGYAPHIPGIKICCNWLNLPLKLYELLLPLIHAGALQKTDIVKSNQTNGADTALRAAAVWKKPFIARCGFVWSSNMIRKYGEGSEQAAHALAVEQKVFPRAARIVVTTPLMKADIEKRVPAAADKTVIIPNHVSTDRFAPITGEKIFDIIFVGRLSPEKNIPAFISAAGALGIKVLIVGQGPLKQSLHEQYGTLDGKLQWKDRVANHELPELINQAKAFILPSLFEGHPKTLIEAMACGMPVIGADSPGIREIIGNEENGLLCGTDTESIRHAVAKLLKSPELQQNLGSNARDFVKENYSLERIVAKEVSLLTHCLKQGTAAGT